MPNFTVIIIGGEELKGSAEMTSMRGGKGLASGVELSVGRASVRARVGGAVRAAR